MLIPPFQRHSWRPLPHTFKQIPDHARMQYGFPREGVCEFYGWSVDAENPNPLDHFAVCLPDIVTIIPVIRSPEEHKLTGPAGAQNTLPFFGVKIRDKQSQPHFVSGEVALREDPREAAKRLFAEQFNIIAGEVTPVLVYQPDARVDSVCYTFLGFNISVVPVQKELVELSEIMRASQIFTEISNGNWQGEREFFSRLIHVHGHANGPGVFTSNVSDSTTSYSIEDVCCPGWDFLRGTLPLAQKKAKK